MLFAGDRNPQCATTQALLTHPPVPRLVLPDELLRSTSYGVSLRVDCSKAERELGMDWLPDTETYNDMAAAMLEMGLVGGPFGLGLGPRNGHGLWAAGAGKMAPAGDGGVSAPANAGVAERTTVR
jgi:hypothetical protein